VECFFIGKQNVVLFPKFKENGWVSAASALRTGDKTRPRRKTQITWPVVST
jgi:hypothetical protein